MDKIPIRTRIIPNSFMSHKVPVSSIEKIAGSIRLNKKVNINTIGI